MRGRACLFVATLLLVCPGLAAHGASSHGPFTLVNGMAAGGRPIDAGEGMDPSGTEVGFIGRGRFWIGLYLQNTSNAAVTLVAAKTPEPRRSLVHQVKFGFAAYAPPSCPGGLSCPDIGFDPASAHRSPLALAPGAQVIAEINYRFVSCAQAKTAIAATGNFLIISYRRADGSLVQQSLPLAGDYAKLIPIQPLRPQAGDCRRSHS